MVTLLEVRSIGGEITLSLAAAAIVSPRRGVNEGSNEEEAEVRGSADMLLRVRSPLSRRGRFLLTEESASSIRFRRGGLGPAEVARVGVRGRPTGIDAMTLYFGDVTMKTWGRDDWFRVLVEANRAEGIRQLPNAPKQKLSGTRPAC